MIYNSSATPLSRQTNRVQTRPFDGFKNITYFQWNRPVRNFNTFFQLKRSTLCANKKHHYFPSGSYIHLTKCTSKKYTNSQAKCPALQVFTRKANEYCFRTSIFWSPRHPPESSRTGAFGEPHLNKLHEFPSEMSCSASFHTKSK